MTENIHLLEGDITKATVDAIVNAANSTLLGGGGFDGAIHRAAGPKLLAECESLPVEKGVRCPTGQARITGAGQLAARYVIHTVGPIYPRESNPEDLLAAAFTHSLDLALKYQCQTVALPAISCGVYGYPYEEAARVSLAVCCDSKYRKLDLFFYLFSSEMYQLWQHELTRMRE